MRRKKTNIFAIYIHNKMKRTVYDKYSFQFYNWSHGHRGYLQLSLSLFILHSFFPKQASQLVMVLHLEEPSFLKGLGQ